MEVGEPLERAGHLASTVVTRDDSGVAWRAMTLEREQEDLLLAMVDAARGARRDEQQWHLGGQNANEMTGPWGARRVLPRDVETLCEAGFLDAVHLNYVYGNDYVITAQGYFNADAIRHRRSPGFAGQEADTRRLLDSSAFREAYPNAFARWSEAEQALRSSPETELTTVGHKAREAMQAFATELIDMYSPADVEPDPALVNKRLGAVIAKYLPQLGDARANLLKALGDYSEACMAVIQRQEHGGQKEGHPLAWADGRRAVFHVASVMYEFATTIEEAHASEPPPPGANLESRPLDLREAG